MAADDARGGSFTNASFTGTDFTGATFRDCDLSNVKITDCWLADVRLSGFIRNIVVNDVDVTAFVEAELDRQHPERAQVRAMRTADDYREMWDTIEELWAGTVVRARKLPEPVLRQRVEDEWSFVETLRHLVMASDAWAGNTILGLPEPFHRLGIPYSGLPAADAAALGLDLDAQPSLDEVLEARGSRMAMVRGIVTGLTDAGLDRMYSRSPTPGHPQQARSVGSCLRVIMDEECEHRRYALRDLAVLEASEVGGTPETPGPPGA